MIRQSAPAKINWFLEITGKRADGYHTLSTVFQTISLADELTLEVAPALTMSCSDPALPTDEGNLAMRAAVRLRRLLKEPRGACLHLKKITPLGAGLGGGSSDAAAVLLGLARLWKRRVPAAALHHLARSLGADVPFFLKGGLCIGRGIGDRLTPLTPLSKTWLVLVYPDFGVSTKEAYARVRLPFADPRRLYVNGKTPHPHPLPLKRGEGVQKSPLAPSQGERVGVRGLSFGFDLFNRFEELVFPDHPKLPALKKELLEAGASTALMSGSGSTVFGVVPNKAQGEKVLAALRRRYKQSWLVHTQ